MSDHYKGCWVAFERDLCQEDAEETAQAIRMVRNVSGCEFKVAEADDFMSRNRLRLETAEAMRELWEKLTGWRVRGGA